MKKLACCMASILTVIAAAIVVVAADKPAGKAAAQAGWQVLFGNKESDLDNWMQGVTPRRPGPPGVWLVKDGMLTMEPNAGYLWTKQKYDNFVLELEFKMPPEGNSGVFIRSRTDDPVQGGMEIQLMDDAAFAQYDLGPHAMGSLYGCVAPSKKAAKPAGEWQTMKIVAKDNIIIVVLNGEEIVHADLNQWTEAGKNPDGTKNKFKTAYRDMPRTGHIGLQDHGQPFWFRNIRVQRLK